MGDNIGMTKMSKSHQADWDKHCNNLSSKQSDLTATAETIDCGDGLTIEILVRRAKPVACTRQQRELIDYLASQVRLPYRGVLALAKEIAGRPDIHTYAHMTIGEADATIKALRSKL